MLLSVLLPLPPRTVDTVLARISYDHRRHLAARIAHRRRTERWIRNMDEPIGPATPLNCPAGAGLTVV